MLQVKDIEFNSASTEKSLADKDTETKKKVDKKLVNVSLCSIPNFTLNIKESILNNVDKIIILKKNEIDLDSYYETTLSKDLIIKFGPYYLQTFDKKNIHIPPDNFIIRHNFTPKLRTRMVDWMLEIFNIYDSDENTFFAAVKIMDKFFWKCCKPISNKSIHIIGVGCIYIASKAYDLCPITMKDIIDNIVHNVFTEKKIKDIEQIILKTINFDIMQPTASEFIQFLLYDLYMVNKSTIKKFRLKNIIDIVENCAMWIAKMCCHFEKYSSKLPTHIALVSLLIGYEMVKDNKKLESNEKQFFVDWLEFLFEKTGNNGDNKKKIDLLYQDVYKTFYKFKKMEYKNLMKYHELYFDE